MLPRSIEIGPVSIHLYGLLIATAIIVGLILAKKRARLYKIPQFIFDDPVLLIPLIFSILGARIYHVIDFWQVYTANPISIFYLANGGLGIWGALIGLIAGLFVVVKLKNLDLLNVLDLAAPSILLGQAIGRFGNLINQEGFGPPTNSPWGIFIEKSNRPLEFINSSHFHPTFFYEAFLNLIFFLILINLAPKLKQSGQVFALYLIFYSTTRFTTEFWRIDTWTIGSIQVAHVIAAVSFIIGFWLFNHRKP